MSTSSISCAWRLASYDVDVSGYLPPGSVTAIAKMTSARLRDADLVFIAGAIGECNRSIFRWTTRDSYIVTGDGFNG